MAPVRGALLLAALSFALLQTMVAPALPQSAEQFQTVTSIDKAAWQAELKLHEDLFTQLAHRLPKEMGEIKQQIETRLAA